MKHNELSEIVVAPLQTPLRNLPGDIQLRLQGSL